MEKKNIFILILTFAILTIVGSLYLFIQRGAINAPFNVGQNPTPTIQTPPTVPTTPTSQIPKGWKTYRNERYFYEISYPSGWYQNDSEAKNVELIIQRKDGKGIYIQVYPQSKGKELEDEDILKGINFKKECKSILFSRAENAYECISFSGEYVLIFLKRNSIFIVEDNISTEVSKRILSTIKFLK